MSQNMDRQWGSSVSWNPGQETESCNQMRHTNPRRRPRGCLWAVLKTLLLVLVIVLLVVGGLKLRSYLEIKSLQKEFKETVPQMDISNQVTDYIETLDQFPSDISGMSMKDKIDSEYEPFESSDTDGDGLTDREELEVYDTDSLNPSTAGDGISDGLKVSNGIYPLETFSPEDVVGSYAQMYPEVSFNDVAQADGVILEEIEGYTFGGTVSSHVYAVSNYTGQVTIDYSQYITDEDYFIFKKDDSIIASYELLDDKNGIVTVKSSDTGFVVGFVPLPKTKFNALVVGDAPASSSAWFVAYPFTILSGKMQIHVIEQDFLGSKEDRSKEMLEYFTQTESSLVDDVEVQHDRLDPIAFAFISPLLEMFHQRTFTDVVYEQLGDVDENLNTAEAKGVLQTILNMFILVSKIEPDDWESMTLSKDLVQDEDDYDDSAEIINQDQSGVITSFDISKDILPFANLATFISPGGNCSGISLITAQVFKETYPSFSNIFTLSDGKENSHVR